MANNTCVLYKSWYDSVLSLGTNKDLQAEFMKAIMDYGFTGTFDNSNPIINALMQPVVYGTDKMNERREKNVSDGAKGGASRKFDHDIVAAYALEGHSYKETAEKFNCSIKSVQRWVKEYKETEPDIILSTGTEGQMEDKTGHVHSSVLQTGLEDYEIPQQDANGNWKF